MEGRYSLSGISGVRLGAKNSTSGYDLISGVSDIHRNCASYLLMFGALAHYQGMQGTGLLSLCIMPGNRVTFDDSVPFLAHNHCSAVFYICVAWC